MYAMGASSVMGTMGAMGAMSAVDTSGAMGSMGAIGAMDASGAMGTMGAMGAVDTSGAMGSMGAMDASRAMGSAVAFRPVNEGTLPPPLPHSFFNTQLSHFLLLHHILLSIRYPASSQEVGNALESLSSSYRVLSELFSKQKVPVILLITAKMTNMRAPSTHASRRSSNVERLESSATSIRSQYLSSSKRSSHICAL
ncbi:hypothetical protein EVAR_33113_1 [Eumeta japonica]|uniref:Uncharacterized protein n=1 Tax=Eumeta variegata TaxID=151549 RepID=A0A4C1Y888_EUMVA|nr:hypothetical protein EVAR_33113_1 [Eumeta japonica]